MKKIVEIVIATILMFILIANTFSFAASGSANGTVTLKPSSTSVNKGDKFSVIISSECSDGIVGFAADLSYDEGVFVLESKTNNAEWTSASVTENRLELFTTNSMDVQSADLYTLTFEVKENPSSSTGAISLSNIELYKTYSQADILKVDNQSVSINIAGVTDTTNNTVNNVVNNTVNNTTNNTVNNTSANTNTTNTNTPSTTYNVTNTNQSTNTTNTNTANNTSTNTNKVNNTSNNTNTANNTTNNTTATTTLPKAGSTTRFVLIIAIGLVGIAFAAYKGYEKYKRI